ncbi:hypothetical protein AWZ03_002489 [Drosophila navojoa]|uniref:Uncharacterized protein n=1 Tax=Drosophila navojoa TaxID=7232 RepID=A0A484BQM0_DRONA|nr:uncharacterized protein LOC108654414 [Drosophila navojoa]TDG51126.1 hypothetical protein AWZ03_002489 [Drosophila navojoa]
MADLPENLQVIKLEPPGTPEKANIKERLNLHVKRRLQQDLPVSSPETPPGDTAAATSSKRNKATSGQSKEAQKQRKPYQKRVDKVKSDSSKCKKAQTASPAADLEAYDEHVDHEASPERSDTKNISRERYKNADILNLVLSTKKRALMQNPEVQTFWSNIMSALKK